MGKTLYVEGLSGISGDMTVAALLDLGADQEVLLKVLKSLPVSGYDIKISRVKKSGIDACDFDVILDKDNHDHDMAYLHGHEHVHEHTHDHHRDDDHMHEHHHHEHATLPGILHIIGHAQMSERAKAIATRIFEIIAEAESKAHGIAVDQVHFHEVGAIDSIVDVVSVAVCLDNLDITDVIVPHLCEGHGTVRCQHGIMPIPVPAVTNIAQAYHLKFQMTEVEGELVTPTGAAIVAAIKTSEKLPSEFMIEKIGIGAGKREYSRPSMLRLMLIKDQSSETTDKIQILETNIDDCSGECLGYLMQRLFEAGARDAHYTPAFMKKNRPGYLLRVICDADKVQCLEQIIFEETTTIGIRRIEAARTILPRQKGEVDTPAGKADIKICTLPDGQKRYYPEYESASKLAKDNQISLYEAIQLIEDAVKNQK